MRALCAKVFCELRDKFEIRTEKHDRKTARRVLRDRFSNQQLLWKQRIFKTVALDEIQYKIE